MNAIFTTGTSKGKIHFPGLNGIRAIAALIVIFFHVNSHIGLFGLQPIQYFVDRAEMSRIAVVLFLVLSGYLITYLLLEEKSTYGGIELRKFYVRRILRIWPLFYLIILVALIILLSGFHEKSISESLKIIGLYSVFLSNFAMLNGLALLTIAPLWSVGVEEQFYIFWPILINKSKNIYRSLWFFLIAYVCFKLIFSKIIKIEIIANGLDLFAFDSLAVGGIVAYLYFTHNKILKWLYNPGIEALSWLFFLLSLVIGRIHIIGFLDKDIYAVAFAIIILNVSTNNKPIISLENRLFNFIGRISYGVYLYHMTLVYFLSLFLKPYIIGLGNPILQFVEVYVVVLITTLGVAYLSYKYFESWFLRLKTRFTKVPSSN